MQGLQEAQFLHRTVKGVLGLAGVRLVQSLDGQEDGAFLVLRHTVEGDRCQLARESDPGLSLGFLSLFDLQNPGGLGRRALHGLLSLSCFGDHSFGNCLLSGSLGRCPLQRLLCFGRLRQEPIPHCPSVGGLSGGAISAF